MLNLDNSVQNSGGAISLQSGTAFPNGQVYGRFFNDTSVSTLYFDNGTAWVSIGGGGGTTPTLDEVLTEGNVSSQTIVAGNFTAQNELTTFSKNSTGSNANVIGSTFVTQYSWILNGSFFDIDHVASYIHSTTFITQNGVTANANGGAFTGALQRLFLQAGTGSTMNINNVQIRTGLYRTEKQFIANTGATIFLQYFSDYIVGGDFYSGGVGAMTIFRRIGFYIQDFRSSNINYTNIWSIYSEGSTIPMYHAGIGFFGTLTNLATTNVSMSLGKPINFENSTSGSAGGNSGDHLIVYVNGVQRKIALLNP